MILNVFRKLHENNVEKKQQEIESYNDDILKADALLGLKSTAGYKVMEEVLNELIKSYEEQAYNSDGDFDNGRIALNKASALKEFLIELDSVVRLGNEYREIQKELIESL